MTTENELIGFLINRIANEQGLSTDEINIHTEFINFGIDSIKAISILDDLEKFADIEINPIYLWDYPTIASISNAVASLQQSKN